MTVAEKMVKELVRHQEYTQCYYNMGNKAIQPLKCICDCADNDCPFNVNYNEDEANVEDFANNAIAKLHNEYKFCEKISDYDAYICQYISDFVKEYLEAQNES